MILNSYPMVHPIKIPWVTTFTQDLLCLKEKDIYIFVAIYLIIFVIHSNFWDLKIVEYYLEQILSSIINQDK